MSRECIIVQKTDNSVEIEQLLKLLGAGEGRKALRSAPLVTGQSMYWIAAARILKVDGHITEAVLLLMKTGKEPRRLGFIEKALIEGALNDADEVLDAVKDLVECEDDNDGSASAKSFLAAWVCADVVGRCLSDSGAF